MTENDTSRNKPDSRLTNRQLKAIPHLVSSPTLEEGRRNARVSRDALYRWLKQPAFKEALRQQRDVVIQEALETLKATMTKATTTLASLLDTQSDSLKRHVCNDLIGHVLKAKELQEFEERLLKIEHVVFERRTYR